MSQAVFRGQFDARGVFQADEPDRFTAFRRKLAGKRAEVVLRKPKSKRSLDMNAYLHKWPFRLLAEHFGDSIEGVKYDLMGECFGWVPGPVSGKLVPVKAHTSDMTVEESATFVDWVIPWAAQNYGVVIPLPGEVM
jgi:hypothetical protein